MFDDDDFGGGFEDAMDPCNGEGGDAAAWEEEQVFQDGQYEEGEPDLSDHPMADHIQFGYSEGEDFSEDFHADI